jgi:predicted porin
MSTSIARTLLTATALALAAGAVCAQSSVKIRGIVDLGATQVSGLKGGSLKQLSSGVMEGSRLIFEGTEVMGGGWAAQFLLEHRFEADTGGTSNRPPSASQLPDRVSQAALLGLPAALQPVVTGVAGTIGAGVGVNLNNAFWDRQAYVALITPVGGIFAGRQYTPAYEIAATFDALNTYSSLAVGQIAALPAGFDIRLSNALKYGIRQGGFTATAMVAAGEASTSTGRFYGAMAMYKAPGWSVGAGYNTRENERGAKSLTNAIVGATVNLGPGRLSAVYATIKDDNPTGLSAIAPSITPSVGATNAALVAGAFTTALRQDAGSMPFRVERDSLICRPQRC